MKDRNVICEYYICKGSCSKGRNAEVTGLCRHCSEYKAKKGAAAFRKDSRRKKQQKADKIFDDIY